VTVTANGVFPLTGLTVNHVVLEKMAIWAPTVELFTLRVCETAVPPYKAAKLSDVLSTVILCASRLPTATKAASAPITKFNFFKT
jgi:hypothetical protein